MEAAKLSSTRGLASSNASSGFNFGGVGSRIAKPLRGGGGNDTHVNGSTLNMPMLSSVQAQETNAAGGGGSTGSGGGGKRSSWFFDRR